MTFGAYIRDLREAKRQADPEFSLRRLAERIGVEPSYLSKLERDAWSTPSEKVVVALAEALGANPDVLLAMTGRVSKAFQAALMKRPEVFAQLLEVTRNAPDHAILRIAREVRDVDW